MGISFPSARAGLAALVLVAGLARPPAAAGQAADDAATERPVVGLVLGGGGARGMAHVGVLQVLEALGVKVDLVVGTSMGAIVGALYASGMSPADMEAWVTVLDWDDLFRDQASFRDLDFRRKREYREFPIQLELGVSGTRVSPPTGLVGGQKLNAMLRRLLLPVATIADFDDLAIPFRAVATDLATGEMVVLGDGDLVDAVRASMSAPAVFSPYPVGDRLLADGGLAANLPVDVARSLGADVVIVVDVGSPLYTEAELTSPLRAARQVATILTQAGATAQRRGLQDSDILIGPELPDIGATHFDQSLVALRNGAVEARRHEAELRRLAVDSDAYASWLEQVRRERMPPERVDFVVIGNHARLSARSMLSRIRAAPGMPLDTALITADVERLYRLGIYERVDYKLMAENEGVVLVYEVREKPWGRNYLRFRVGVADNFAGESAYNLATNLRVPHVNELGGELQAEIELGDTRAARLELYQPLGGASGVFMASYAGATEFPTDVYVQGRAVVRYHVTGRRLGMAGGLPLGNWAEIRSGLEIGRISATRRIGSADLPEFSASQGRAYGLVRIDALDDPAFPRHGVAGSARYAVETRALGAHDPHERLTAELLLPLTVGRTTFLTGVHAATSLGTPLPAYDRFSLGGFLRLTGYPVGEVVGDRLFLAQLIVFHPILGDGVFGGLVLEAGNAWADDGETTAPGLRHSVAMALGLRGPLGPLYLSYGFGDGGRRQAALSLGRSL